MTDAFELSDTITNMLRSSKTEKEWEEKDHLAEDDSSDSYVQASAYYELGRLLSKASEETLYAVIGDLSPEAKGKLWRVLEELRAN